MNLIMHRNYQTNAPAKFYEYSDRIELDNPGGLYGKAQPENFPNTNDYRNPVIAEAMKVLGYVNRFNRGISMVQEILEENKNGQAIFDFKNISTFKVTVMNADPKPESGAEKGGEKSENVGDMSENNRKNVGDVSEKNVGEGLTERQRVILKYIEHNNTISAKEISELLQIADRTVERDIQKLRTLGILERIGGDRGGYWKIK